MADNESHIRLALESEIEWINACYDVVHFVHSHFENEIIAIAEVRGEKAGIGRLVRLEDGHWELGGMYVLEAYRRHGIARQIVPFLLNQVPADRTIYCIPFQHLITFYERFGFSPFDLAAAPSDLVKKVLWCQETYSLPTALLARTSAEIQHDNAQ